MNLPRKTSDRPQNRATRLSATLTGVDGEKRNARLTKRLIVVVVSMASLSLPFLVTAGPATAAVTVAPPTSPPAQICGMAGVLNGPTAPPPGAVVVSPTGPRLGTLTQSNPAGTTFYLLAGTHLLGTAGVAPAVTDQVIPKAGNVYIGAPGAILDGQNVNRAAFTQKASGVRISFLTIQHFNQLQDQGVVNHDSGNDWVIDHNTITANHGAATMAGARNQITYNCLSNNGQYGFNAFQMGNGITGLILDHNEIGGNATDTFPAGCGCTGGGKFWANTSTKVTNNWVHDNRGTGLWADTNNTDFLIEGNYIENNDGEGIWYEISYNATMRFNTLKRNALVKGQRFAARGDHFPVAAIYISESGGDSRASSAATGSATIDIHDNNLDNNWGGVAVWENADRFCSSAANTSGKFCTMVNPTVANLATCAAGHFGDGTVAAGSTSFSSAKTTFVSNDVGATINSPGLPPGATIASVTNATTVVLSKPATTGGSVLDFTMSNRSPTNQVYAEPYLSDCRWKSQNVKVHNNRLNVDPTAIGCTSTAFCGRQALLSNSGSYPRWPTPYPGQMVENAITFNQGNTWANNTYIGPWQFVAHDQGVLLSLAAWQAAPYNQDVASNGSGGTTTTIAPATTTTTVAPATTTTTVGPATTTTTVAPSSANYLDTNSANFDTTLGRWVPWYGATPSRSTAKSHTGAGSLRIDLTANTGGAVQLNNWPGFPASAGTKSLSLWGVAGNATNQSVTLRVTWRDRSGKSLQVDDLSPLALGTTWKQATGKVVAPVGTAYAWVTLVSKSGVSGNYFYLDQIYVGL